MFALSAPALSQEHQCGLADTPENYAPVTFTITPSENGVILTVEQVGYASQESCESSAQGWEQMLAAIKAIAEAGKTQ